MLGSIGEIEVFSFVFFASFLALFYVGRCFMFGSCSPCQHGHKIVFVLILSTLVCTCFCSLW